MPIPVQIRALGVSILIVSHALGLQASTLVDEAIVAKETIALKADSNLLSLRPPMRRSAGYYWRLGLSTHGEFDAVFADVDCAAKEPAALYGCGSGNDGNPASSRGSYDASVGASVGLGFYLPNNFRAEISGLSNRGVSFYGDANINLQPGEQKVKNEVDLIHGMVFMHYDFEDTGYKFLDAIRPHVGFGVGISRYNLSATTVDLARALLFLPEGNGEAFTYAFSVGITRTIAANAEVELTWRHFNTDAIETDPGVATFVLGTPPVSDVMLVAPTEATDLTSNVLEFSFRYGL